MDLMTYLREAAPIPEDLGPAADELAKLWGEFLVTNGVVGFDLEGQLTMQDGTVIELAQGRQDVVAPAAPPVVNLFRDRKKVQPNAAPQPPGVATDLYASQGDS